MNITKNQHYVPQCLIKHFSWEEKKDKYKVNIFDTIQEFTRYNQSIKNVCASNYFYGKDNRVENILSEKIETPVSPLIDSILKDNFSILKLEQNWMNLLKFISTLLFRTPQSRNKVTSHIQKQAQSWSRELFRLNNIDPEEAERVSLNINEPETLVSWATLEGYYSSILLSDLSFHIIKNKTDLDFFVSDHPVFLHNWLYRNLEHPGVTDLVSQGLQIFIPLSPRLVLCLYDSQIYKYGAKNNCCTYITNPNDVKIINSFQVINSESRIIFFSKETESHVKCLFEQYRTVNPYTYKSIEYEIDEPSPNQKRTRHIVYNKLPIVTEKPTFMNIKRKARKFASAYRIRSQEILDAYHQLRKK